MTKRAIVSLVLVMALTGLGVASAGVEAGARPYLNLESYSDRDSTIDIVD